MKNVISKVVLAMKENYRKYGTAPYQVVLVHGGPGAAGEMAPVAEELCSEMGVAEGLQTGTSLHDQIEELHNTIHQQADHPVILVGFSWGAWLSMLTAAKYPQEVRKLILISSGPFEEKYVPEIMETRYRRLNYDERKELNWLMDNMAKLSEEERKGAFARFGSIFAIADAYDALDLEESEIEPDVDLFNSVWPEAAELRRSGELLAQVQQVRCPVVAIHGDYDPHPAAGVEKPLAPVLPDFQFNLLKQCGHKPWIERLARDKFFEVLKANLNV